MRIAVIGDGAMGTLFGALLSQYEEVSIISLSQDISAQRTRKGIAVDGKLLHPVFTADPHSVMVPDLLLLFVKSSDTESALENASCLIGEHTLLMTLQNGAGHEAIMRRYAPMERIVIGKTEQNASLVDPFTVHHGNPRGATVLSMNGSDLVPVLGKAGFPASVSDDINRIVWRKLLTNASLSAATGVLGSTIGFLGRSEHASALVEALLREAVDTAAADGDPFDFDEVLAAIRKQCSEDTGSRTSIERDLANGRRTEADFITGYVARKAAEHGVQAPVQNAVLSILHAKEDLAAHADKER